MAQRAGCSSDNNDRDLFLYEWFEKLFNLQRDAAHDEVVFAGGGVADRSALRIYCQNINGLKDGAKRERFRNAISSQYYDVIILLETNLDGSVEDSGIVNNDQYVLFRNDRCKGNVQKHHGFGVLVAVKKSICSEVKTKKIGQPYSSNFEELWIRLAADKRKKLKTDVVLGAAYFPQKTFREQCNGLHKPLEKVLQKYPNTPVLFFGDFNLPKIKWEKAHDDAVVPVKISYLKVMLDFYHMELMGFRQNNHVEYKNDTMLDLIFSNITEIKVQETERLANEERYHPALQVLLGNEGIIQTRENRIKL